MVFVMIPAEVQIFAHLEMLTGRHENNQHKAKEEVQNFAPPNTKSRDLADQGVSLFRCEAPAPHHPPKHPNITLRPQA